MSDAPEAIDNPDALAALIEGLSDDEIAQAVEAMGAQSVIEQVATEIPKRFNADKAAGQSAVVQWDVTTADGVTSFHVDIADGACTSGMGPADAPRLTLGFGLANFIKFIAGKLDGMQAFMGGQLKLTGDMMFAQQMQTFFDT